MRGSQTQHVLRLGDASWVILSSPYLFAEVLSASCRSRAVGCLSPNG